MNRRKVIYYVTIMMCVFFSCAIIFIADISPFLYFAVRFICRARQMNLLLGGLHSLRIYASAERQCKVKFNDELNCLFFKLFSLF